MSANVNPDELDAAILAGAVRALRRRAEMQAENAQLGTTTAENRPTVSIRTGEAAVAARLAEAFNECADSLETGRPA